MMTSNNTLSCFFCGRDLSLASQVNYVAEGPICSMCLRKGIDATVKLNPYIMTELRRWVREKGGPE